MAAVKRWSACSNTFMQAVLFEITSFISVVFINSLLIVLSPFSFVLSYIKFRAKIRIFAISSRQPQPVIPTAFSNFQKQVFRIEFCFSQTFFLACILTFEECLI